MTWESTVFGVAGLVIYSEGRKVVQWVLAHWLVLSGIHSLEPTKTGQATRCTSSSMDYFPSSHQGEERARIPAEFRARIFKPLGALREKTPQDYRLGGRLASSAGVQ